MAKTASFKQYIGDGVYVEFNGEDITLTTENGITTTNRIVLEIETYYNLTHEVKRFYRRDALNNNEGADDDTSQD